MLRKLTVQILSKIILKPKQFLMTHRKCEEMLPKCEEIPLRQLSPEKFSPLEDSISLWVPVMMVPRTNRENESPL